MGIAMGVDYPRDLSLRSQLTIEGFYRFLVTPTIQMTPDVQFIINPSSNPSRNLVTVFGLRARVDI